MELPQFSSMSNSTTLYTSESIAELDDACWHKNVYSQLDATLRSPHMLFPCPYGVAGHKRGHIRFGFCEAMSAPRIAECLNLFLPKCREFGEFTSLVIFEKPAKVESMEYYHRKFWRILNDLADLDPFPWPTDIPREIDHKSWEFCFRGEPIFALGTTPSHVLRKSRRSSSFTMTFQPRWVFDKVLDTPENAAKVFSLVKERLDKFDLVEKSPFLGKYGEETTREAKQYFIADDNTELACPFEQLGKKRG